MGLGIHAGYGLDVREDRIDFSYDENILIVTDEDLSQVSDDIWEEYFYDNDSPAIRSQAVKVWNRRPAKDRVARAREVRETHWIQGWPLDPKHLMVHALRRSYIHDKLGWG